MSQSRPSNLISKHGEERFVEIGQRILLDGGYPNPDRVGCPGAEVLKSLAERKVDLREAREWVLHIGSCSPCFVEYTALKKKREKRRDVEYVLVAAVLVIAVVGGVWLWKAHRFPGVGRKPSVVAVIPVHRDLRNWLVFRGEQAPSPHSGPVPLPRGRLELTVSLPSRWKAGNYQVLIATETGKVLVEAKGSAATQKDGVTVLKVMLDDSKIKPGAYMLGIGEIGSEPRTYPVEIR